MLPAPYRLFSKTSFAIIFKEGLHASYGALSIKWRSTHQAKTKVGFIASKKNFAKACDRNRAKRLLREAMRAELFQLRANFDIIVLYRYIPERLDFDTIAKTLHTLLEKNNLLQKIS
jgi:ribonuclease P protein component